MESTRSWQRLGLEKQERQEQRMLLNSIIPANISYGHRIHAPSIEAFFKRQVVSEERKRQATEEEDKPNQAWIVHWGRGNIEERRQLFQEAIDEGTMRRNSGNGLWYEQQQMVTQSDRVTKKQEWGQSGAAPIAKADTAIMGVSWVSWAQKPAPAQAAIANAAPVAIADRKRSRDSGSVRSEARVTCAEPVENPCSDKALKYLETSHDTSTAEHRLGKRISKSIRGVP